MKAVISEYSTDKISKALLGEIVEALQNVSYGSVELIVQDKTVTQITVRKIKKTNNGSGEKRI